MSPCLSVNDLTDSRVRNLVFSHKITLSNSRRIFRSYVADDLFFQFGAVMLIPSRRILSALVNHVSRVIRRASLEDVARIETSRRVTSMQSEGSRPMPVGNPERKTMGQVEMSIPFKGRRDCNFTVLPPPGNGAELPKNALVGYGCAGYTTGVIEKRLVSE